MFRKIVKWSPLLIAAGSIGYAAKNSDDIYHTGPFRLGRAVIAVSYWFTLSVIEKVSCDVCMV